MFFNLRRAYARIDAVTGQAPIHQIRERLARAFGVDCGLVEAVEQRLFAGDTSLNVGLAEGSNTERQDLIADDAPSPEEQVAEASDMRRRRGLLKRALSQLTTRERMIVRARRLDKERVPQIENEALNKLRAARGGPSGRPLGDQRGRCAAFAVD